jgi:crossover junction endodeoxyribonuclease RuvC
VIVLGVDPGSVAAGWGLVRRDGSRLEHIDAGILRPPKEAAFADRLAFLHDAIAAVLALHTPDAFAIESVFSHNNARSALQLGHARGIFLLAAAQASLEVHEYTPATVKKALTGNGAADKRQVRFMVERLLGVSIEGAMDRSDALAVAICHAQSGPLMARAKALSSKPTTARPKLRRTRG